ncbi:hypothetical protein I6F07_31395 [Ensifer sp. IC4062]|nr:hypothetical protein [Ensifer sp. IC4062]MCA1444610.1 hypothetical protein [Ensifer sp. IC4062]
MAVKLGLNPDAVTEVVNSGTGRSYASKFFLPRVLKGMASAIGVASFEVCRARQMGMTKQNLNDADIGPILYTDMRDCTSRLVFKRSSSPSFWYRNTSVPESLT